MLRVISGGELHHRKLSTWPGLLQSIRVHLCSSVVPLPFARIIPTHYDASTAMNETRAPSDTALWKRLNALLEEGMALPASGRRAWLDALPAADAALKPRLEAMLERA